MIAVALTWNLVLAMFKRTRPQKKKTGHIGDAKGDNLYAVLLHGLHQRGTGGKACRLDGSRASLIAEDAWRESQYFRDAIDSIAEAQQRERRSSDTGNPVRSVWRLFELPYGGPHGFEGPTWYRRCKVCNDEIDAWRNCEDCANDYWMTGVDDIVPVCLNCPNPHHQEALREDVCHTHGGSPPTQGEHGRRFEGFPDVQFSRWEDMKFEALMRWYAIRNRLEDWGILGPLCTAPWLLDDDHWGIQDEDDCEEELVQP